MMSRFDNALKYVLENEGPYSDDPRDPGGATQFGIILTEYQEFLGKTLTPEDVKNMPIETAKTIYLRNFWDPIHGDAYDSDAKATAIFDTAVNKGLTGCKNILNGVFKTKFSGDIWFYGPDLTGQVNGWSDQAFLQALTTATIQYIDARIKKYPKMEWARHGWTNRANRLLTLNGDHK